ncbi:putative essential for the formation of DNA replication focal centers [Lyophyllum shimeji]|uniref:3'-5' exonuclease n=1 Tax=Lyophyllum shimeji TaxID=47721 RepID=A0A9P3UUM2_LYOSH|nr:putative essential for the formation of DNA replication focal centers [Lyophyllum shimeji]
MDVGLDDAFDAFDAFEYTETQLQAIDALERDYFTSSSAGTLSSAETNGPAATPRNTHSLEAPLVLGSPRQSAAVMSVEPTTASSTVRLDDSVARHYFEHDRFVFQNPPVAMPAVTPLVTSESEEPTTKRSRGRPKGSRNKKTLARLASEAADEGSFNDEEPPKVKRPRGRPPGTGAKQLTKKRETTSGGGQGRVGRPRKPKPTFGVRKLSGYSLNKGLVREIYIFIGFRAHIVRFIQRVAALPTFGPSYHQTVVTDTNDAPETHPGPRSAPAEVELPRSSPTALDPGHGATPSSATHPPATPPEIPASLAPETDPDQIIQDIMDSDSEDDEAQLMEDGLGEDEGDDDEDEEDVDKDNDGKGHRRPGIRPLAPLPPWLKDVFDACVEESSQRGPDREPPLYRDHKTFWFPRPANFFLLRDSIASPQQLYDYDIFLWDPMALTPDARLTFRSGMSLSALALMRSCFQHGMGAKQFSNALRVQHLQNYDRIHLQYLHTLAASPLLSHSQFNHTKFKPFLPFDDRSPDGFHGFIPSAQWLRDVYDQFIEEHADQFNQHTAMLTAKICGVDHSFKLTKHVAKVDGIQIFTGLLTLTNEMGQIRICNLVATKSHSQFVLALQQMRQSLEIYGHDQPSVIYTDSMNDKDFLEQCFPSLQQDVVPVEKFANLLPLQIPETFSISIKNTVTAINDAMRTILEHLPDDDGVDTIIIGLDAEWNVEVSQRGYVTGRGQTAILQVAHGTHIYILQIGHMLAGRELPLLLKQVLANPKILKVGCSVTADLKYLQEACQSSMPFVGGVNLGMFAKERFYVKSARIGLAELCATVLGKWLNKDVPERISTAWENDELTPAQVQYAALDAHASLEIYTTLASIPMPTPLPHCKGDP